MQGDWFLQNAPAWPDLSPDLEAFELATATLGPDATVSAIAKRAQQIKDAIKRGEIVVSREQIRSFWDCLVIDEESAVEHEKRLR